MSLRFKRLGTWKIGDIGPDIKSCRSILLFKTMCTYPLAKNKKDNLVDERMAFGLRNCSVKKSHRNGAAVGRKLYTEWWMFMGEFCFDLFIFV